MAADTESAGQDDRDSGTGRRADRIFGGAVALLALLFVLFAVPSISDAWKSATGSQYYTVGPRLIPYIAGYLTLAFALLSMIFPGRVNHLAGIMAPGAGQQVGFLIVLGFAYIGSIYAIGFIYATVAMLAIFLVGFGVRNWLLILATAIIAPLIVHFFFFEFFNLELPTGIYGISFR